jgi:hypothetical protein
MRRWFERLGPLVSPLKTVLFWVYSVQLAVPTIGTVQISDRFLRFSVRLMTRATIVQKTNLVRISFEISIESGFVEILMARNL